MTEETIVFRGETDGTSTTGNYSLTTEWFDSAVTELKLDKGLEHRIFVESIDAEDETLTHLQVSIDGGSTWRSEGKSIKLPSPGRAGPEEMPKPIIVTSRNDETMIRFRWEQPAGAAVMAYLSATMVIREL